MSKENLAWLNQNVLRGFTDKRGRAWHYSASEQGAEPNHYPGAIPVEDLHRRLFGWHAEARPIYVEARGGLVTIDGQVAWCRSDTDEVLGIHSDGYNGHQYGEWLVRNVEALVGGQLGVANAGLLRNGAIAWVQIETPDNVSTEFGVVIRPFIMATTSFDGSIATTYKDGYTDTVCDNTRDRFLSEDGNVYRVKHTANSAFSEIDAQRALNLTTDVAVNEIATLVGIDVSDAEWQKFVEAHAPIAEDASKVSVTKAEKLRSELTQLWNNDVRVSPWRGTAWGVVQAVNTHLHHMSTVRNVNSRFERNMMRAVTGGVGKVDRQAVMTLSSVLGREIEAAEPKRAVVVA